MNIPGIKSEKLIALLKEGFSEEYLRDIMQFKPSPDNPAVDMNEYQRSILGISTEHDRAAVSMTNWDVNPVAQVTRINPVSRRS